MLWILTGLDSFRDSSSMIRLRCVKCSCIHKSTYLRLSFHSSYESWVSHGYSQRISRYTGWCGNTWLCRGNLARPCNDTRHNGKRRTNNWSWGSRHRPPATAASTLHAGQPLAGINSQVRHHRACIEIYILELQDFTKTEKASARAFSI